MTAQWAVRAVLTERPSRAREENPLSSTKTSVEGLRFFFYMYVEDMVGLAFHSIHVPYPSLSFYILPNIAFI